MYLVDKKMKNKQECVFLLYLCKVFWVADDLLLRGRAEQTWATVLSRVIRRGSYSTCTKLFLFSVSWLEYHNILHKKNTSEHQIIIHLCDFTAAFWCSKLHQLGAPRKTDLNKNNDV